MIQFYGCRSSFLHLSHYTRLKMPVNKKIKKSGKKLDRVSPPSAYFFGKSETERPGPQHLVARKPPNLKGQKRLRQ